MAYANSVDPDQTTILFAISQSISRNNSIKNKI